jgi:hypothetical protein
MRKVLIAVTLAMLATLSHALAAVTPYRIVTAVDDLSKTFSCHASSREPTWTYSTNDKTVFRVEGKVRRGEFADIKVGDRVSVHYHISGNNRVADRVIVRPKK